MTIGQVSRLLGVPVPTLRSWELRYGVGAGDRTPGGHRRYSETQVQVLRALNAAVARGLAPSTAAQALRGPESDAEPPVDLLVQMLDRAASAQQDDLTTLLDESESRLGLERTVDQVLVPALREIGLRWELGLVDVGVEHLATAAVRRWIARRQGTLGARPAAPVLLAAAPGNEHTIALEAFGLLLTSRGSPTVQLGANSPVQAILSAARTTRAAAVVVTAHQVSRRRAAIAALDCLQREYLAPLYFAGAAFDSPGHRRGVPGSYLGTNLPQAVQQLEADVRRGTGAAAASVAPTGGPARSQTLRRR
jgi:DNA-binding transcriptional MerR regulator